MSDRRLAARDGDTFAQVFLTLLPEGPIWPRALNGRLYKTVRGLMGVVARFAADAARFLNIEAYPPDADLLLADWERVLGLPDPCLAVTDLTVPERRQAVAEKLARRPGRQDRYYFLEIAEALGYAITITEYIPGQCGMTQCGAQLSTEAGGQLIVRGAGCGTPILRYVWLVTVAGPRLTWFAVGGDGGRAGQDPHVKIRRAEDLECLFRKLKPAHTHLIFDYTGI